MLREFHGIIDATGLCSLGQSARSGRTHEACLPFWAVLDECSASDILHELLAGRRERALKLLEEFAVSLGTEPSS